MKYLQLLKIWNRLKRLLRGLIIKTGMKKPIDWARTFAEFMGILESLADVQDATEREMPDTPDSDPSVPMKDSSPPQPTKDSAPADPYAGLVPDKKADQPSAKIAKTLAASEAKRERRRLFGRK